MHKLFKKVFVIVLILSLKSFKTIAQSPIDSLKVYYQLNISEDERAKIIKDNILSPYLRTKPDSLLILAEINLQYAQNIENIEAIANAEIGLGTANNVNGRVDEAFELYFEALKKFESTNNQNQVALTYMAIGNAFGELENREKSIEYYNKALVTKEKLMSYDRTYYSIKINQAIAAGYVDDYSLCFNNLYQAKAYFNKNNAHLDALVDGNLGNYYNELYQEEEVDSIIKMLKIQTKEAALDSALFYHNNSLKKAIQLNYEVRKAYCFFGLGETYRLKNKPLKAISYYKKSIDKADTLNNLELKMKGAKGAYLTALLLDDNTSALAYFQKHITARDSLQNDANKKALIKQELLYKYEKETLAIAEKSKSRQRLFISGIICLVPFFIIFYLFRSRQFARRKEQLQKSFALGTVKNVENERQRVSSELHDSVGQRLLLLKKGLIKEDIPTEHTAMVDEVIKEMRNISQNLHPFQFEKLGLLQSLDNLINAFQKKSDIFYSADITDVKFTISQEKEIHIYRMTQEALNNVEKHSKAKACILKITKNNTDIIFQIKDNGIGFDKTKVFGEGIGMRTLEERARIIEANLNIKTSLGKGTTLTITLPKQ